MSNHDNGRRIEKKRTEHGSRWENSENDRNSSKARRSWKKYAARAERRTGTPAKGFHPPKLGRPRTTPSE
jgi:hypothetical protein